MDPTAQAKKITAHESGKGTEEMSSSSGSKLNPLANEWKPATEEDRSLYITFSNGFPLNEQQIFHFFSMTYGPQCVEKVSIHQSGNRPPQSGRIVLRSAYSLAMVLNGQEEVQFVINGRSLWCKKFIPRQNDRSIN